MDGDDCVGVLCGGCGVACVVGGDESDSVVAGWEVDVGVGPGAVAVEGGVVDD